MIDHFAGVVKGVNLRSTERKFAWTQTPQLTMQSPSEALVLVRGIQTRNRVGRGALSAARSPKIKCFFNSRKKKALTTV